MTQSIAALYVQTNGAYFGLPGVDPWDEKRDAMRYAGPDPVVAHPPCKRWCLLAPFVEARHGYKVGDDGGTFAAALASVRAHGGVLEHPAYSRAWAAHGLNAPPTTGGWVNADFAGGWTCCIEQERYGHQARKATWLYAFGCCLPDMRWGKSRMPAKALVSRSQVTRRRDDTRPRLESAAASKTPDEFREALIAIARSCRK